jgi:hypothetical protein
MNPLKNSKMKNSLSNRFSTVATNAFVHALEFAKIVHGDLFYCTALSCQFMTISFS